MKKAYLFSLCVVVIAPSSMAAIISSQGTLNINGVITDPTCVAEIGSGTGTITNSADNNLGLTLPTVATSAFGAINDIAGTTPFYIKLKQVSDDNQNGQPCTSIEDESGQTLTPNVWFDHTDVSVSTTGNLINEANTNKDVEVQLLNDEAIAINLTQSEEDQLTSEYDLSTGILKYSAQYISVAEKVKAQDVQTRINFNVVYK